MAQFKLLAGQHVGPDPDAEPVTSRNPATGETQTRQPSRTYKVGDIVESDVDLVARHGPQHFQLVGGEVATAERRIRELEAQLSAANAKLAVASAVPPAGGITQDELNRRGAAPGAATVFYPVDVPLNDGLDSLSLDALKDTAADEEIPLHGAKTKADIAAAIRAGRK